VGQAQKSPKKSRTNCFGFGVMIFAVFADRETAFISLAALSLLFVKRDIRIPFKISNDPTVCLGW